MSAEKESARETAGTAAVAVEERQQPAAREPDKKEAAPQAGPQASSKVKGADLAMFVYRRKWYAPGQLACPECGAAVGATLLTQQGQVALACTNGKCKFSDSAQGSWRAHTEG